MRIVFHASSKDRERQLAEAFCAGARIHGHETLIVDLTDAHRPVGGDLACMVGVKSKDLWDASRATGQRTLMLDKGYDRSKSERGWNYWRVSLDAQHPTHTTLMRRAMPSDRFEALGWEVRDWQRAGSVIVFAGSSEKYHRFHGLPHPTDYAKQIIRLISKRSKLPIIYRPKPSWKESTPIDGTEFSRGKDSFFDLLARSACLVTHGSNACVDAMISGVPAVTLGDGVAAAIGATEISQIRKLPEPDRAQWLANLAYHQWTEDEMARGQAWETIGGWLNAE